MNKDSRRVTTQAGLKAFLTKENWVVALATLLLTAGMYFTPPSILESIDYVAFYKPNIQFLKDALSEGRLPLWNPYIGLGRPFLADIQNAVFYPPIYLIVLGGNIGLFLFVWFHCLVAVFGMRTLGRTFGLGKGQNYLVAFSFFACGALTARFFSGQILYACTLCYIPVIFYSATRLDAGINVRRAGFHATLMALQFLCGHPQVFWFTSIAQFVFVLCRGLNWPARQRPTFPLKQLTLLAGAMIWCAGLVAVVLLPFLELVGQGNRSPSLETANFWRLEWKDLLALSSYAGGYEGGWERNIYIGVWIAIPGLLGLAYVRDRNVRGLLGVVVVALLVGMGGGPLFKFLFRFLPGFSTFRLHCREAMLIAFALLLTAGIWLSKPHPVLRRILESNFIVPPKYLLVGLIVAQALTLFYANLRIKKSYSFKDVYGYAPDFEYQWTLVSALKGAGLLDHSQAPPRVCIPPIFVPHNYAMIHRYSNFDAYTSLFLRRPWDYLHDALKLPKSAELNTSLSYKVYFGGPIPYRNLGFAGGFDLRSRQLKLQTNRAPRAIVVYAANLVKLSVDTAGGLNADQDSPQMALIEGPLLDPLPELPPSEPTVGTIRQFDCNSLAVDFEAKKPGLLVLAEAWYPGWKAQVNGRTVSSFPANGWMRAFEVRSGQQEVRVFFHQNYLRLGCLISLSSILLLIAGALFPVGSKCRQPPVSRSSAKRKDTASQYPSMF